MHSPGLAFLDLSFNRIANLPRSLFVAEVPVLRTLLLQVTRLPHHMPTVLPAAPHCALSHAGCSILPWVAPQGVSFHPTPVCPQKRVRGFAAVPFPALAAVSCWPHHPVGGRRMCEPRVGSQAPIAVCVCPNWSHRAVMWVTPPPTPINQGNQLQVLPTADLLTFCPQLLELQV